MLRSILTFVAILVLASPLAAEGPPPSPGRYQIVPDGDGFIRLDTENGALAHCAKRDGAWFCDTVSATDSGLDRKIEGLADEVSSLKETIGRLTTRLDGIEDRFDDRATASPKMEEQDLDRALTFAERLMRRFFDFVRGLKDEEPPQRI